MKKTPKNTIVKIEHNGVAFGCMGRSGSTNLLRYFNQQRIDCHCLIEEFNDYEGESYLILRKGNISVDLITKPLIEFFFKIFLISKFKFGTTEEIIATFLLIMD